MSLPVVVIVGRPNVGKSTIFNRTIRRRAAVVDPVPGVTRDRHYSDTEWDGLRFTLVDTGGYLPPGESDKMADAVREQTLVAADEADLVMFVVDALSGLTDGDRELAKIILSKNVPVLFVSNKVDDTTQIGLAYEAAALGLGEPYPASALTGYFFADMLDALADRLRELKLDQFSQPVRETLSLAIIGAPNSGKSSLVNRLSGDERMVVSDIPGTTRDAIDTIIRYHGRFIRLIDTAGLKRKRLGQTGLEFYTTLRALRALDRCNVAVIMIDATLGLTQGDMKLVNEAAKKGVGIILAVNKWDAVEKNFKSADHWLAEWKRRMTTFSWVPVLFISALTGQRTIKVIEYGLDINKERNRRIPTPELNDTIGTILINRPPPAIKGKSVRIKYVTQVSTTPPNFVFHASYARLVTPAYKRFAERLIREKYSLRGTPIRLSFRNK